MLWFFFSFSQKAKPLQYRTLTTEASHSVNPSLSPLPIISLLLKPQWYSGKLCFYLFLTCKEANPCCPTQSRRHWQGMNVDSHDKDSGSITTPLPLSIASFSVQTVLFLTVMWVQQVSNNQDDFWTLFLKVQRKVQRFYHRGKSKVVSNFHHLRPYTLCETKRVI